MTQSKKQVLGFYAFKKYHNANYHDGDSHFDERTYKKSNVDDFDCSFVQDCYDHFEAGAASRQNEVDKLQTEIDELQKRIDCAVRYSTNESMSSPLYLDELVLILKGEQND